jgi:hypothetical protein
MIIDVPIFPIIEIIKSNNIVELDNADFYLYDFEGKFD